MSEAARQPVRSTKGERLLRQDAPKKTVLLAAPVKVEGPDPKKTTTKE